MLYTENDIVELKRKRVDDLNKEIIAFLNTVGGVLYIGIDDDGTIIGVNNLDSELLAVNSIIRDSILPNAAPFIMVKSEIIEGKDVIVLNVSAGTNIPYYTTRQGFSENGIYVRVGTAKRKATPEEIKQMVIDANETPFEDGISVDQDLSFEELKTIYRQEKNMEITLTGKFPYLFDSTSHKYNNAAYLVSDQNLGPRNIIRLMKYDGIKASAENVIEDREFLESIVKQYVDASGYIELNNTNYNKYIDTKRVVTKDYPIDAIRETLVNSIIHRDYLESGTIRILLFDNRIEIVSPGELVVPREGFIGLSKPRNELSAKIFQTLGYMENFGTGFQKIIDSYLVYDLEPLFDFGTSETKVTLLNVNYEDRQKELKESKGFFLFFVEKEEYKQLSLQEKNILIELNKKSSITRKDVEGILGVKETRANEILKSLESRNHVVKEGKARSSKYVFPSEW